MMGIVQEPYSRSATNALTRIMLLGNRSSEESGKVSCSARILSKRSSESFNLQVFQEHHVLKDYEDDDDNDDLELNIGHTDIGVTDSWRTWSKARDPYPDWSRSPTCAMIVVLVVVLLLLTFTKSPSFAIDASMRKATTTLAIIGPMSSYFVHSWLENDAPPKTRRFSWILSELKLFERPVLAINDSVPGPTIEVLQYDRVSVYVQNRMNRSSTIHFHGISQYNTNSQDGVPFVTQPIILPGEDFLYEFQVADSGTFWWHAHSSSSRLDGLFGALIVHPRTTHVRNMELSAQEQILQNASDFVLLVGDWYAQPASLRIPEHSDGHSQNSLEPLPDSIQVNGHGIRGRTHQFILPKKLKQERYWRLRLINVGGIAGITATAPERSGGMVVLEADSTLVQPVRVDRLTLAVGQRYSVLIDTDDYNINEKVFLHFELDIAAHQHHGIHHLSVEESTASLGHYRTRPHPRTHLEFSETERSQGQQIASEDDSLLKLHQADNSSLVGLDTYPHLHDGMLHPLNKIRELQLTSDSTSLNLVTLVLGTTHRNGSFHATINGHAYKPSDTPLIHNLSERKDISGISENVLSTQFSNKVLTLSLSQGQDVLILLRNINGGPHPMHIHGHRMQLLASDTFFYDPLNPESRPSRPFDHHSVASILGREKSDGGGDAIWRDTVNVASDGWSLVRIKGQGVGVWAFHCHIVWHELSGMMMILKVN